jgi:hypothetical protein
VFILGAGTAEIGQASQALHGIFTMTSASVLRALMCCGILQARSVNLGNVGLGDLLAF